MAAVWPVIASRGRLKALQAQLGRLMPQLEGNERIVLVLDDDPEALAWITEEAPSVGERLLLIPLATNVGVDRARMIGNSCVPTDAVVCEIDDHDLAEPGLLAAVRSAFSEPKTLIAYCDVWHTDSQGRMIKERIKNDGRFAANGNLAHGMKAYRKWAYDAVGGYPLKYFPVNDYALLCKIEQLNGGECAHHIRQLLVTVVIDRTGISGTNMAAQQQTLHRVARRALREEFELPYAMATDPDAAPDQAPEPPPGDLNMMIPKYIHFVWIGSEIPRWAELNIDAFRALNPDFIVLTHNEDILLPSLKPAWDMIKGKHVESRQADLVRVSALTKFGGWYFDVDFYPFRPLSEVYHRHGQFPRGCFLSYASPRLVGNGVIAASINSPLLKAIRTAIEAFPGSGRECGWGDFGPKLYTRLVKEHPDLLHLEEDPLVFHALLGDEEAQDFYLRLWQADFDSRVVKQEFRARPEKPFAIHMHMKNARTLPGDDASGHPDTKLQATGAVVSDGS